MTTTLRLNDDLKRACDEILDDIGISFSAAVTIFMNEVVRTGGIPFHGALAQGHRPGERH